MQIYLPIAEMAVSPWLMVGLGLLVGAMSGMFGVGGGFLMTPLLMLIGIPATSAVVTGANVAAASSMTSIVGHYERRAVDTRMGLIVSIGGVLGVGLGALIYAGLRKLGIDEGAVRLAYVLLLGLVGTSITREAFATMKANAKGEAVVLKRRRREWMDQLPLKVRFARSRLYMSMIPPLVIGLAVGILSATMGVGGGFLLIPLLIYVIHLPASLVVGTSTLQVLIVASTTTFLQASTNGGLDLILSGLLISGAVVGAQLGVIIGRRLKGELIRTLFGLLVLLVAARLALDLIIRPEVLFSTSSPGGGL